MKLYYKKTKQITSVYDVNYDHNGFASFLIYINGEWIRESAKHFIPLEVIGELIQMDDMSWVSLSEME